jgi:nuclear cap-binding protein subunit 2
MLSQVRDEYREDFDAGRGGWGHLKAQQEAERERQRLQEELYRDDFDIGMRDVPIGGEVDEE